MSEDNVVIFSSRQDRVKSLKQRTRDLFQGAKAQPGTPETDADPRAADKREPPPVEGGG